MRRPETYPFVWPLIWLGLILANALGATAKFAAPTLAYPVALDVGRHVFTLLNCAELGLAAATLLALVLGPGNRKTLALALPLLAILAVQTLYLLPALDRRALLILAGTQLPNSSLHVLYSALEGLKILLLVTIAALAIREMRRD